MARIRVRDLAKELEVTSKDLREHLAALGIEITNPASSLDDDTANAVRDLVREARRNGGPAAVTPAPSARPPVFKVVPSEAKPVPAKEAAPAAKPVAPPKEVPVAAAPAPEPAAAAAPPPPAEPPPAPEAAKPVEVPPSITVRGLAEKLRVPPAKVQRILMDEGIMATVTQSLARDQIELVAGQLGVPVTVKATLQVAQEAEGPRIVTGEPRPPVVTVMGHVDHGKTTLLDAIRRTKVTDSEVGAITQHIGAYQAEAHGRLITFVDTPGHEAFTALRSRGAQATDIVVLVVAADDGVMPQTREALDHAKAAGVPIIVAISKVDLPTANLLRVQQQLMELGLIPEALGGDTVTVEVVAPEGRGVDRLLEMILLVADLQDLRAPRHALARGVVVETQLDRRRGTLATVLVQEGTLRIGTPVTVGRTWGRVKAMFDGDGRPITIATPSMPVVVMGLEAMPEAGDPLEAQKSDRDAKVLAETRRQAADGARTGATARAPRMEDVLAELASKEVAEFNLILKCDVQGSVEALQYALADLAHPRLKLNLLHVGIGDINESDTLLAAASGAVIIGFQVGINQRAREMARLEEVEVRNYSIIYDVVDDLRKAMEGRLEPEYVNVVTGRAEVRAVFKMSKGGVIAGCYVAEGVLSRGNPIRVKRNKEVVYEGALTSLRRFKDDVREVAAGMECGAGSDGFSGWEEGDEIELMTRRDVRHQLV